MTSPTSIVVNVVASTTPLVVISVSLICLHFYFRLSGPVNQRKLIWWDDFCLLCAVLFFIASFAFILLCVHNGFGEDVEVFSDGANPYLVVVISITQTFLLAASTVTKMSLAFSLMRFKNTPAWSAVLFSFVTLYPATLLGLWIPIIVARQTGDPTKLQSTTSLSIAILAINLVTTVFLASMPTIFIMALPSPHPSKPLAITLAVLGVLVSTVHISHLVLIRLETSSLNALPTFVLPTLGATLLVVAATAPTLLGPMMRALSLTRSPSSSSAGKSNRGGGVGLLPAQISGPMRESRHLGLDGLPDNPRISVARRAAGYPDRWSWFSNASRRFTEESTIQEEPVIPPTPVSFWNFLQPSGKSEKREPADNRFSWLTFRSLGRTEREVGESGELSRPGTSGSVGSEGWRNRMSEYFPSRLSQMGGNLTWGRYEEDIPPVPPLPMEIVIHPPSRQGRRASSRSTGSQAEWMQDDEEMSSRGSRREGLTVINP